MPLYCVDETKGALSEIPPTSLSGEGKRERDDLQSWLRDSPEVLDPELFVLSEEYSDWEGTRRSIDLLALDRSGRLVVIELKRDEGAFMDLQAIHYAALVANLTFEQAVAAHERYLSSRGIDGDARERILSHLGIGVGGEVEFNSARPRIFLVARDFPQELTTSVLWLNDSGLDIRCVRLLPYRMKGCLVLDATVLLPLPEAERYTVRFRDREAEQAGETFPEIAWTREEVSRLAALVRSEFPLLLLDTCARRPGEWVTVGDIRSQGTPDQQASWPVRGFGVGALGVLTKLTGRVFGRRNWPMESEIRQGFDSRAFCMSEDIAAWWSEARTAAPGDGSGDAE